MKDKFMRQEEKMEHLSEENKKLKEGVWEKEETARLKAEYERMKHEYYEKARQDKAEDHSDRQPEALLAELETLLQRFYRETQKLRGAFISPGMANAIGCVFRPYRRKTYRSLAALREKILRCTEEIHHLTDIDEKGAFAESY